MKHQVKSLKCFLAYHFKSKEPINKKFLEKRGKHFDRIPLVELGQGRSLTNNAPPPKFYYCIRPLCNRQCTLKVAYLSLNKKKYYYIYS